MRHAWWRAWVRQAEHPKPVLWDNPDGFGDGMGRGLRMREQIYTCG